MILDEEYYDICSVCDDLSKTIIKCTVCSKTYKLCTKCYIWCNTCLDSECNKRVSRY